MTALVKKPDIAELVKWEVEPAYNRISARLNNADGSPINVTSPWLQPLKVVDGEFVFVKAGHEGDTTHLLLRTDDVVLLAGASTPGRVAALRNSPATVSVSLLPAEDIDGGTLTWASVFAAMPLVKFESFSGGVPSL